MKKLVHPIYGVMNPKFHQEQYRKPINKDNKTALYSSHGIKTKRRQMNIKRSDK